MGVLGMVQDIQRNQIQKDVMSSATYCNYRRKNCKTIFEKNETTDEETTTVINSENNNEINEINENIKNKDTIISGWLRVYCGPDRSDLITIEPSRMVHCSSVTTAEYVVKELNLPDDYTLWMQIGGVTAQRLSEKEKPLQIQDDFYKKLGYVDSSRRSRLEIDPEMKYLLRFYIGPSEIPSCKGVKKSGAVDILKGLVFPQWKRRYIMIIGSQLFLYPSNSYVSPDIFDLSGADIIEHSPTYDRLILKIVPKIVCENNKNFYLKDNNKLSYKNCTEIINSNLTTTSINNAASLQSSTSSSSSSPSVYNSSCSINSFNEREKVLFLGFEESWERDLWSAWLLEATTETNESRRLDIGNSGLQTIPEVVLQSISDVEELSAGQNQLQEIGLKALSQFSQLKILRLPGNGFKKFPTSLLSLTQLTVLDLADNLIDRIPGEIYHLDHLEELRLDRNEITELPNSLRLLRNLRTLYVSYNRILKLPPFLIKMRTMGLVDMYAQKGESKVLNNNNNHHHYHHNQQQQGPDKNNLNPPLTKVNLRANSLKGNIILGNYGNLTQLDISENEIEALDLSALGQLESLQCCRNKLVELTVNGGLLNTLITGNNELRKLSIAPAPVHLRHLDMSYNKLTELPQWLSRCHQLRTLFANNNQIHQLPEHLFCGELNTLHTLQLGYNELTTIPEMPDRKLPLQELFLQCNHIESLPENFFSACENLVILNVSSNKLTALPSSDGCLSQLERLYATKNFLNDRVLNTLIGFKNLKIFHAAYNQLTIFPDECIENWPELEELVLSGNKLRHIPDILSNLTQLKVLRLHSNQLQSVPALAKMTTLRVLDLAHNQLDKINLVQLVPKKLQFLDLSCNLQLQVDPRELQACRSQRAMSLVDVSGKNRASLPTTCNSHQENSEIETPWKVGFSETAGEISKLYITQLRLPNFCNTEGLFGMFDGELNSVVPNLLVKVVPKILLEERAVKETASEYMKYTLLSAHRELRNNGQKHGVSATLCHIAREKVTTDLISKGVQGRKFILRVASVGETSAFLLRKNGNIKLTPKTINRQIGNSASFPLVVPDPEICEVTLGEQDEYLVICNKKLWEIMDIDFLSDEIRNEENVILSAKRIQDIAQSFGAEENLSIILVKFVNIGTDIDLLLRELRQTVRRKSSGIMANFCKCGCCCESNNSCCHSAGSNQFIRQFSGRSDRSSPSGQSDHTGNEGNFVKANAEVASTTTSKKSSSHLSNEKRSLKGGVARAVRAKIEEEKEKEIDETDSALSEEQFKCWEYMLEQNTQLLFDKELNTISRAFTKNKNLDKSNTNNNILSNSSSLLKLQNNKVLSASSPQLIYGDLNQNSQYQQNSFLSKHFGSARSFHPQAQNLFKSMRFNSGRIPPIGGGPNAAYFGSLQRLMPYNLEYDFAVMHERNTQDDSLEHEARMRQYWGVATTEL